MKKIILSTIVITALSTFWVTKSILNSNGDHHHNDHTEHHGEHHDEHEGGHESEFAFTPEILKEFGVQTGTASGGVLEEEIELPGEIQIDPDRLAHITPRFEGVIKEVYKQIGDKVQKNELLAIIESNESLTSYELRSSIKGIIIDMHFTKGETAQKPENYFAIADLSEVWVSLSVYLKHIPKLKVGQIARILVSSDNPPVEGKISYISPTLDEQTRTASARVILKNRNSQFRPGQFVTGQVVVKQTKCQILVPKTALETVNDQTVIFIKDTHGIEPSIIQFGRENHKSVEVLSGLKSGQVYVKKGGFILKAQLAKGSFGGGHNH
ncbi:MAG: efflux RND transporter periplasmic adaptor subunit [Candidatus Marinimicrobia bacterium]|nr:efflux RND transporter periplasmic adaptor subunit [Candidatus Neomarinimicrobiota bacterium]